MGNFPQHQSHEAYIFLTSNKFIEKVQKGDTALAQWKYSKDEPKRKRIKTNTIYTLSKIQVIHRVLTNLMK